MAHYLRQGEGEASAAEAAQRRFQLADRLASLYSRYLVYRPDWLLAWERGEHPTTTSLATAGPATEALRATERDLLCPLWRHLRNRLGAHVTQKGSLVAEGRFRFDFSHPKALTPEEVVQIEADVNAQIRANEAVSTRLMRLVALVSVRSSESRSRVRSAPIFSIGSLSSLSRMLESVAVRSTRSLGTTRSSGMPRLVRIVAFGAFGK